MDETDIQQVAVEKGWMKRWSIIHTAYKERAGAWQHIVSGTGYTIAMVGNMGLSHIAHDMETTKEQHRQSKAKPGACS